MSTNKICLLTLGIFIYTFVFSITLSSNFTLAFIIGLLAAVPLGFAFLKSRKFLFSEKPKRIFYKLPVLALVSSVVVLVVAEILLYIFARFSGEEGAGFLVILLPIYCWVYILPTVFFSLVFSLYFYLRRFSSRKLLWAIIFSLIFILPYLFFVVAVYEKASR